jgi:lipoyl synthase
MEVRQLLEELKLTTVCSNAHCPNIGECFSRGTATFMILGRHCTRSCRFCAVDSRPPEKVRADESEAVAEAVVRLGLHHVVVTSVTRDDLPDGGANHFASTCHAIRKRAPEATVEILTPDFQGDPRCVDIALSGQPDVFNHNVETVPRLYPHVRPEADYQRSLDVLQRAAGTNAVVKSGLMVGLGETRDELHRALEDLHCAGCRLVTIGQYLAPSREHVPVERFLEPQEFEQLETEARALGFEGVAASPFVRSSYRAEGLWSDARTARDNAHDPIA